VNWSGLTATGCDKTVVWSNGMQGSIVDSVSANIIHGSLWLLKVKIYFSEITLNGGNA
jgi:hypothetical protein